MRAMFAVSAVGNYGEVVLCDPQDGITPATGYVELTITSPTTGRQTSGRMYFRRFTHRVRAKEILPFSVPVFQSLMDDVRLLVTEALGDSIGHVQMGLFVDMEGLQCKRPGF